MNGAKHIRAYLRAIPSLPIERQREMARDASVGVTYEWGEGGRKINVRDMFVRSLQSGDVAWTPDIRCLLLPRPPRTRRPVIDLSTVIDAIRDTGAIIVDGRTGIASSDRKSWANHLAWALEHAARGERNQKRRKRTVAAAQRGLVIRWKSPAMAAQHARYLDAWCNLKKYPTAEAAHAAMPDELRACSVDTVRRIFGPRGGRGGRPRKQ